MSHYLQKLFARISPYFRRPRMIRMAQALGITENTAIIDVGGYPTNWELLPFRPRVTFLNLHPQKQRYGSSLVGDGCQLPFRDDSFDLCFSNSVIEHVGDFDRQRQFADECRRVGKKYYLQTPDFWFPIEPHFIGPGIHWLPYDARGTIARYFSVVGYLNPGRIESLVPEVRLLSYKNLRELFPDATITHERVLGLSKSLIVVGPTQCSP